ncbi:MAG: glycosyltransferase family 9 protein [Planctomycetota bacterium]
MPIPMHDLQRADRTLGQLACIALQPVRWARALRRRGKPVERVLLIKFWGIGSLELLTPAVRTLRRRHPSAELHLLTLSPNGPFVQGLGIFDNVLAFDVSSSSWLQVCRHIAGLVLDLRSRRYDAVYDFEFFTRFSAVVSLLSGATVTRGFASPSVWRGGFHTETSPFNRYWHVARNFRCLAGGESGFDVTHDELSTFRIDAADEIEAATVLFEAGLGPGGPLIVLNPNAGTLSLERRWPRNRFAELARRLIVENGARVVLIGSAAEKEWTDDTAAMVGEVPGGRFANVSGKLSIGALHALLDGAHVFVSNDSGPMHLGSALGTPTIGLFGPETPIMYRPLGQRASFLYDPPPCSPCINVHNNKYTVCWRGRPECLMNLSVDRVHSRVLLELEAGPKPQLRELTRG